MSVDAELSSRGGGRSGHRGGRSSRGFGGRGASRGVATAECLEVETSIVGPDSISATGELAELLNKMAVAEQPTAAVGAVAAPSAEEPWLQLPNPEVCRYLDGCRFRATCR